MKERLPGNKSKRKSVAEAFSAIYKYCAYQERSHQEVRNKLFEYGLYTDDVNEVISKLIVDGFLNEERFAKAFTGGKFRIKRWGRNKIVHALESKGLTTNCIKKGLGEIEESDYRKSLSLVILKKAKQLEGQVLFIKRDKVARFAISRGYESDLVWPMIKELIKS